jgi:hypothetical protein
MKTGKLELYTGIGVSFFDFQEKGIPPGGSFTRPPIYEDALGTLSEDEPTCYDTFWSNNNFRIK